MDNRNLSDSVIQKKAHKFNIIDFILIVIIIAAVLLLGYIMVGNNLFAGSENTTILYTVEIQLIRNEFITQAPLMKGAQIIDSVRSYDLGEIQEVKITDAYSNTTDLETGVVTRKAYPDHSKVTITVKAQCKKEKAKYEINGKTIRVGARVDFRTPYLVSYGNCVAIEEINDDETNSGTTVNDDNISDTTAGN